MTIKFPFESGEAASEGHTEAERKEGFTDVPVSKKTVAMQRLQDFARLGYTHFSTGLIKREKVQSFRAKMAVKYGTGLSRSERQKWRRHGESMSALVIWIPANSDRARFWLLFQPGHPGLYRENTSDLTQKGSRVTMPREPAQEDTLDYELVRLDDKWTWRMTEECYERWRQRWREATTAPDDDTRGMLWRQAAYSFRRMPGFRGVRRDAGELKREALGGWSRIRSDSEGPPSKIVTPAWLRRVQHHTN